VIHLSQPDSITPELETPPGTTYRTSLRSLATRFPATTGLIILTFTVFLAQWLMTSIYGNGLICGWGDIICALGAKVNDAILSGQLWRLFTPLFIHVTPLHVAVNMYSLYVIGPPTERFFGSARVLFLYLSSGIAGVIASLAFSQYHSAGASGATFGLLGAMAAFLYLNRSLFGRFGRDQLQRIIIVAILNLGLGLSPGIDNWGHIGGLTAGFTATWYFGPRLRAIHIEPDLVQLTDIRSWSKVWRIALLVATTILALTLLALISFPHG
jgi:rhomboid protease GluP